MTTPKANGEVVLPLDISGVGGGEALSDHVRGLVARTPMVTAAVVLHCQTLHEVREVGADKAEIKAKFKMLVKRHHPDANNGDRGTEDKLREIIQAYNYLKTTGALK